MLVYLILHPDSTLCEGKGFGEQYLKEFERHNQTAVSKSCDYLPLESPLTMQSYTIIDLSALLSRPITIQDLFTTKII